ncbi:hypothetical protein C8R47DRAFT_1296982 [Mycena vitilis]|nr:hypothetical protein C8R47DRAFT_1296982 [Mycena vitilis]
MPVNLNPHPAQSHPILNLNLIQVDVGVVVVEPQQQTGFKGHVRRESQYSRRKRQNWRFGQYFYRGSSQRGWIQTKSDEIEELEGLKRWSVTFWSKEGQDSDAQDLESIMAQFGDIQAKGVYFISFVWRAYSYSYKDFKKELGNMLSHLSLKATDEELVVDDRTALRPAVQTLAVDGRRRTAAVSLDSPDMADGIKQRISARATQWANVIGKKAASYAEFPSFGITCRFFPNHIGPLCGPGAYSLLDPVRHVRAVETHSGDPTSAVDGGRRRNYIDDMADKVAEGSGDERRMGLGLADKVADARDYHLDRAIQALNQELSRAPIPALGGRIALPDILSRSPTPLAPYRPQPMPGSRAPTPIFEADSPRAATPLFFPMSEDEDASKPVPKPHARRASSLERPSPSTAKRRRLEGFAKKFFHLEAEDDSDDEDDGDDESEGFPMAEFIDDDPVDDAPIVVVDDGTDEDAFASQATEAERLAAVAAYFEEMARRNRPGLEALSSSPHDLLSRLPDTHDPDMYRFAVPRGNHVQLLQYLSGCSGVKSVFFRERGAGGKKFETVAVYVETDNLVALQRAMAKYSGGYAMRSREPVPIDVQDRQSTLDLRSIISPVGRWARVRAGSTLYKGDLAFVQDESSYLVVPRLSYGDPLAHSEHRPGAQLFDPQQFRATQNGHELQKFNQRWLWRGRGFAHGLEECLFSPRQLAFDGVIPTDVEERVAFENDRALFEGSPHDALKAPFVGPCCALQEGDRVVVNAGEYDARSGYIVALADVVHRASGTGQDYSVRIAAVLPRYDGTTGITRKSLRMAESPAFFVPVGRLRLHALATIRTIAVGDRVLAVGGHAQGVSGRVASISELGTVTVSPTDGMESLEVETAHLQRQFRVGDIVEVNRRFRNVSKGTVGFITEVSTGGFVHLFRQPVSHLLSAMKRTPPDGIVDSESKDAPMLNDPVIYVPTTHLDFALLEDNGLAVHSSVSPVVRQELDTHSREWEQMKMSTGLSYIGCEIMVAGRQGDKMDGATSFARKGLFGTVFGYKFIQPPSKKTRAKGMKDGRTSAGPDVELHVRYDGSLETVPVRMNQVVERFSRLSLEHVVQLRGMYNIMAKHRQSEKNKGGVEERIEDRPLIAPKDAWFETSREPEPLGHIYGPPRDIGEATGHWLAQKNLVGKRIDIKIEGVPGCLAQYGRKITGRVLKFEGQRGFVKIDHPLSVAKIGKELLECRTVPMHHPAKVPPPSIKPYRLAEPDLSGTAHCISSVVGRVIIIGPNVHGYTQRIGEYAETVPTAQALAPLPTPIVEVRFPLLPNGERPPNEDYHLESLCRALNETLHSCGIPATNFEAVPPKW